MGLISALTSLLSRNTAGDNRHATPEQWPSEQYGDYEIIPAPVREEHGYRINGVIRKGEHEHIFIRADTLPSADACATEMIRKAKQMIDQQGDSVFN